MKAHLTILASLGMSVLHAHPSHSEKSPTEKTRQITLPDRILTVHKLIGPPVKSPFAATSPPEITQTQPNLPTHYYFVHALVCEDKRTYLEWHPLSGPDQTIFQAWSDLDWSQSEATGSFQRLGHEFVAMTFVNHTTKKSLLQKGKPTDPENSQARKKSALPSSFQLCGPSALKIGGPAFMEAYHHHLQKPKLPKPSPPKEPAPVHSSPKRSTITYWRHR